jgi:hypothetical protein
VIKTLIFIVFFILQLVSDSNNVKYNENREFGTFGENTFGSKWIDPLPKCMEIFI